MHTAARAVAPFRMQLSSCDFGAMGFEYDHGEQPALPLTLASPSTTPHTKPSTSPNTTPTPDIHQESTWWTSTPRSSSGLRRPASVAPRR